MLLYIHIPFCDSKCSYCAFNSYVDKFSQRERYMDALSVQLSYELERFNVTELNLIETVFIGGGTPSTVDPKLYQTLFETIRPFLAPNAEITTEANPNSATYEWLEGMKKLGVNRISFGVQSFNDEKLKTLGRAHNTSHALQSIQNAQKIGFKHLSIDLIYGVSGDTQELLLSDINQAFSLPIDHLSLYALTIEENTVFEKTPERSHEELELTQWLFNEVSAHGFEHYEISNFGKYKSAHNLGYWEGKSYIGLGAGAVGFLDTKRFYPSTDVEYYISHPCEIQEELLEKYELSSEKLFLGWRSSVGVDETILNPRQKNEADLLTAEKILFYENGRYFNPNFLLADEIALRVEGY
ncbi:MAG: radical SAM family heme chaperone HemW [Sulfuricurvum sp.]|uniref:radical SAM family heme chaperone HemW n=1 Tax=Sulfuricurvum sp. TaxID=2025608 RepID=UPI002632E045|nr:radical SAM family heme chaperone HemW [Sulfuricurvum sp.]MDD2828540.1 radical SAM family heme chaperone HemW [Sulfuricurvum sp.]MDD4948929.1 radical SAM family heme chaperone HemW [Sulfuricurvum sp.]